MGYDAAKILVNALERAQPALTPEAIRDAIATTKDVDAATGKISMDENRNAIKPVVVVQVKDRHIRYATRIAVEANVGPRHAELHGAREAAPANPLGAGRLLEALINGLAQGAMIALVALGYTMVYGILKLINFAHSEVFMMGAYFGVITLAMLTGNAAPLGGMSVPDATLGAAAATLGVLRGHPLVATAIATVVAMACASLLGIFVERVAYRPLRGRGKGALVRITPLVTALGMSVLLQNVAQLVFAPKFRPYPQVVGGAVNLPGIGSISTSRILILVAALVVMVGLELIVKSTWFGKSMRALSANEEAARLMGVRTSRVIATTFALGSALAALGAVLFCLDQSQVYPTMGVIIGTRAFVAAVLGGIGSITGAMLGGLLIGIIGELVKLSDYSGGVDVLVFVVLILVLLVRPAGLLGSTRVEKV
jgi:branched-chain amino acid transport system permease protein